MSKFFFQFGTMTRQLFYYLRKKLDRFVESQLLLSSGWVRVGDGFDCRLGKELINLLVRYVLLSLKRASFERKPLKRTSCILNLRMAPGILGKFILKLPYIIIKLQTWQTLNHSSPYLQSLMPPKRHKQNNNQPKIIDYSSNNYNHSLLTKKEQLDKEIAKLIKVRKEIESRQMDEAKIIKKILTLQIDQSKTLIKEDSKQQDQEYVILTTQENVQNVTNPSILKLILGDYGSLHQTRVNVEKEEHNRTQAQSTIQQWKQHGNLNQQLLVQYQNDFVKYLHEMQYVADSLSATRHKF